LEVSAPMAKRHSEWYARNRERQAAYAVAYNAAHRVENRARKAAYNAAHREEIKAYNTAWHAAHRAPAAKITWRATHRAEAAAHRASNRFGEVVPRDTWNAVWFGECFSCGLTPARGVDHIVPRSRGGRNIIANLQPSCSPCNRRKGARL